MPKYYFDFEDGTTVLRDAEGFEFPEAASACDEMRRTMLEMACDHDSPRDDTWQLNGVVRDRTGVIWRGKLSFEASRERQNVADLSVRLVSEDV